MNRFLLDEKPLFVLPSLAKAIGLNEAIILQQLHYWLQESRNIRDGYKWVYNTYEDWQKQFPFWSETTIKRTIRKLENQGIVVSDNFNSLKIDKTKWYRIDYDRLDEIISKNNDVWSVHEVNLTRRGGQFDPIHEVNLTPPITRIYTDNTTECLLEENEDMSCRDEISLEYQQKIGQINGDIALQLDYWRNELGDELVKKAIDIAYEQGKRRWSYIRGILKNFKEDGITSLNDLDKQEKKKPARRGYVRANQTIDAIQAYIDSLGEEE
ncbi:DnaD domain protein [Geobacillus stearothermophilus]|uniref:DnaD domain-containing protein n=3 Tax=Geobacillus stearothermophilus TaxID=1422 RepID=UPI002E21546A|nr:DnaD domain protein [Geobacillus stearothermophilus]MED4978243.1 DnaD domain protein [Geobacillus stearothermophilus]